MSTGGDGPVGTALAFHKVGARGIHTGHISAVAVRGELGQGIAAVQGQTGGGTGVSGDEVENSGAGGRLISGTGGLRYELSYRGRARRGPIGVHGIARGDGAKAGFFDGEVGITGDLKVNGSVFTRGDVQLVGADLAEQFDVEGSRPAQPGRSWSSRQWTACG